MLRGLIGPLPPCRRPCPASPLSPPQWPSAARRSRSTPPRPTSLGRRSDWLCAAQGQELVELAESLALDFDYVQVAVYEGEADPLEFDMEDPGLVGM